MRKSALSLLVASGAAVLAASAHHAASAASVAGMSDGDWIPYSVSVAGHVASKDGRAFRIDGVAVEVPDDAPPVDYVRGGDLVNYDSYRFAKGDFVAVVGSLQQDGSVLAVWFKTYIEQGSAATPLPTADGGTVMSEFLPFARYHGGAGRFTSGVVESVATDEVDGVPRLASFVVDGVTYRIDASQTGLLDYYAKAESHVADADGSPVALERIAAGDAVLVDWSVEESDGSRDATRVSIRQTDGGGATLEGTVTGAWGDDFKNYNFAVDGVPVVANDWMFRTDYGDDDPYAVGAITHYLGGKTGARDIPYSYSGVGVGMHVRVDGTLRSGRLFADRVVLVIEDAETKRALRAARRAGRLRTKGVLTAERDGSMRLAGLPVTLPGRASRAMTRRAATAASRPVRIVANVRGGALVATQIGR